MGNKSGKFGEGSSLAAQALSFQKPMVAFLLSLKSIMNFKSILLMEIKK